MSQFSSLNDTADKLADDRHGDPFSVERIRDALRGLRFGAVTITVQDGFVVQVDRTEKVRLARTTQG